MNPAIKEEFKTDDSDTVPSATQQSNRFTRECIKNDSCECEECLGNIFIKGDIDEDEHRGEIYVEDDQSENLIFSEMMDIAQLQTSNDEIDDYAGTQPGTNDESHVATSVSSNAPEEEELSRPSTPTSYCYIPGLSWTDEEDESETEDQSFALANDEIKRDSNEDEAQQERNGMAVAHSESSDSQLPTVINDAIAAYDADNLIIISSDEDDELKKINTERQTAENYIVSHSNTKNYFAEKKFRKCPYCEKKYIIESQLNRHLRMHAEERPFVCNECAHRFAQKGHLDRHVQVVHSNEALFNVKKFVCHQCHTPYASKQYLKTHIRMKHPSRDRHLSSNFLAATQPRSVYVCVRCKASFTKQDELIRHFQQHFSTNTRLDIDSNVQASSDVHYQSEPNEFQPTRPEQITNILLESSILKNLLQFAKTVPLNVESISVTKPSEEMANVQKPHACLHCDKRFRTKATLKIHLRVHTNERPYVCGLCPKRFAHSSSFSYHIGTHTSERPYVCTQCRAGFKLKNNLRDHVRNHTDQQLYVCAQCKKSFYTKGHFNAHLNACANKRLFVCTRCGLRYNHSYQLRIHIQGRHACEQATRINVLQA